jgi:GTP-binding protein
VRELAALLLRSVPEAGAASSAEHGNALGARTHAGEQELAEHMVFRPTASSGFRIESLGEGTFAVRGRGIERLFERFDIDNDDAMAYLEGRLRRIGVLGALESAGFQPGDEIEIAGVTFELNPQK